MALEKRDEELINRASEEERERDREKGMDRVEAIPGNFYGKCLGSHNPG